jgi:hypothetical protein
LRTITIRYTAYRECPNCEGRGDDGASCRPRDHVLDEALVTGNVDDAGPPSTRKVKLRVPWHDRDTPAMFLFQAVGIRARHVTNEGGLAVVHVPRRPYGEGYPVLAGLTHAHL